MIFTLYKVAWAYPTLRIGVDFATHILCRLMESALRYDVKSPRQGFAQNLRLCSIEAIQADKHILVLQVEWDLF